MKLASWNVNGIRAIMKKDFLKNIKKIDADILCLQETKGKTEIRCGYGVIWNIAKNPGYAGTAVLTKTKPISITKMDEEGRIITVEFEKYFIINVYTPNSQRGLKRIDYRIKWDEKFRKYISKLNKPVIFCGDLNVAHKEIDIANPESNIKNAGFTPQERESFSKTLSAGYVDTFRLFNNKPENYTWWTYRFNARARNIGWRLDYICADNKIKIKEAGILKDVMGSDHCPIYCEFS